MKTKERCLLQASRFNVQDIKIHRSTIKL